MSVNPAALCVEASTGTASRAVAGLGSCRWKGGSDVRLRSRRTASLGLAFLAAPALLITLAQPAYAASGSISDPAAGQTFTNGSTLVLRAQINRGINDAGKVALTIQLPGSSTEFEVASHTGGGASGGTFDLQFTYDPSCPSFPGVTCNGRPAPNGTHVVRLRGTSSPVERSFVMKVPPRRPSGVTATTTGQSQITVRWDRGNEPDLAGYDVISAGSVIARDVSPDRTEHVVDYPSSGAEGEKTFSVVAKRRTCPGCSEVLESARSDDASARIDAPPPPPPSQDPAASPPPQSSGGSSSGGGGTSGGSSPSPSASAGSGGSTSGGTSGGGSTSGGSTSGSTAGSSTSGSGPASGGSAQPSAGTSGRPSAPVIAQRQQFALTFKNFQPKLGAPKLPPLPNFADPEVFEDEGTYEETLDFGEQDVSELATSAQGGGSRSVVEEFVTEAFEGRKLWSSIGWSLILFLIAGHLRRWLNAVPHP